MDVSKQIKSLALVGAAFAAFSGLCFGGQDWQAVPIGPFGTLNNRDNSFAIPSNQAQDLLNVELTPGGKSVRRRKGFGLAYALAITTSPVHGVYTFFDSNGNSVDLAFNDVYMSASINSASPSVVMSTGSNGATYQCTDSLGFAYCANSSRTNLIKTNGATFSTISAVSSTGTMVAACPTRLAMAGFSDRPSGIDFSAETDFTTWGTGSLGTSAAQFTINAPGAKITHIVYAFNRLMWFKNTSFGYILIGNQPAQSDWVIKTVAFDVGTNDNTSVYREGVLYFRGSDGHIYGFDGTTYQRLTKEVSGTIALSQIRTSNSWTQTSAADFNGGSVPVDVDSTSVSGSLISKTTSYVQTTTADWNAGTFDNTVYVDTETNPGSLQTTFPDTFSTFRQGGSNKNVWSSALCTSGETSAFAVSSGELQLYATSTGGSTDCFIRTNQATLDITSGVTFYFKVSTFSATSTSQSYALFLSSYPRSASDSLVTGNSILFSWSSTSAGLFHLSNFRGRKNGTVDTNFDYAPGSNFSIPTTTRLIITSAKWEVWINNIFVSSGTHTLTLGTFYPHLFNLQTNPFSTATGCTVDDFTVSPQTFTYTSKSLDTGIVSPIWSPFTATTSGSNTLTFTSKVSANNVSFDAAVTATSGSNLTSNPKRFAKINAIFNYNETSLPGTPTALADFTVTAGSSGTFQSAVNNASALSAWDTFQATKQDNGGSNTFAIRSATGSFSVSSSTPTNWTTVSAGAVPSVSTGTFFQIRDILSAPTSTCTPTLNDITQNWFEGAATDKAYATYFDDKIIWAIAYGSAASTNNRLLIYDMLNQGWLLHDIPANGFFVRQNNLYFGHATSGNVYKFGVSDNDAGSAINSYWKSKDFYGGDPFTTQEIANISLVGKSVANSSMTVTYTLDGQTSTSYTVPCYNSTGSFVEKNRNLPAGVLGSAFNVKVGNNAADQPWEVFGIQVGIRERTWIPTP